MQNSQLVSVRRERWRVVNIRAYEHCKLVTLSGVTRQRAGVTRQVLTPFDDVVPIATRSRPRVVRLSVWRRAFRDLLSTDSPPGSLRTGVGARIDLLPHQLEPALAVLRGLGSRLLLADEVGLGKTIQAALVISELQKRAMADRVLVLSPAGLREQWGHELSERFDLQPTLVDASSLRRLAASLPVGTNPWLTAPLAIASIDYVKRAEVLLAVSECPWDLVVVDEAHGVAGTSDRHDAVHALASRAAYVIALTATPHSGDRRAFVSLCGLGAHEDALLLFRRTRADVRLGVTRRTHTLHVRISTAERDMHALLQGFSKAVAAERRDTCLALAVLHKRALSSPWSLEQSVLRRLSVLSAREGAVQDSEATRDGGQLTLPLDDLDGELNAADEPPEWPIDAKLSDPIRERRLLRSLAAAARAAVSKESKLHALIRLLRRANEPAVVFTEYRDTLEHIRRALEPVLGPRGRRVSASGGGAPRAVIEVIVVHGGLSRSDRSAALAKFSDAPRAILLATDAASEGLNLHYRCRLIVNLELPWNPVRLEQRIGRVDRIGQRRTVHAFHLVAGDTAETGILARLDARISRARLDIGDDGSPMRSMPSSDEPAITRWAVTGAGTANDTTLDQQSVPNPPNVSESGARGPGGKRSSEEPGGVGPQAVSNDGPLSVGFEVLRPDLRQASLAETVRLVKSRLIAARSRRRDALENDGPLLAFPRSKLRQTLGLRVLMVWRLECEERSGRIAERLLLGTEIRLMSRRDLPAPRGARRQWIESLIESVDGRLRDTLAATGAQWEAEAQRITRAFMLKRRTREQHIAEASTSSASAPLQGGLFDRRAERQREALTAARREREGDIADRLATIDSRATLRLRPAALLLVLAP